MTLSTALGRIMDKLPEHVRDACTPAAIMRRVYGIAPGWQCPGCARPFELSDYPSQQCRACGRPYPRRCTGVPDMTTQKASHGCGKRVEPVQYEAGWGYPAQACDSCQRSSEHQRRAERLRRDLPRGLADDAATDYWDVPHRYQADEMGRRWVEQYRLGYDGGPSALHLWGSVGTGKTRSAARTVWRAVVERGYVESVVWMREQDLLDAHSGRWRGGDDRRDEAWDVLERAKGAPLLVVDELWAHAKEYTDKARSTIGEVFRVRFEERMPTLVTSNEPPQYGLFDSRVDSRWGGVGQAVEVTGPDLRRARG